MFKKKKLTEEEQATWDALSKEYQPLSSVWPEKGSLYWEPISNEVYVYDGKTYVKLR